MKIYNDSIENAVGVNSTSFGEYIGSAFSSFTPPLNGLMVQGNVGIGTTAPTQNLHVQGNFRLTGSLLDNNNNTGSSGQLLASTGSGVAWTSAVDTGITSIVLSPTSGDYYFTNTLVGQGFTANLEWQLSNSTNLFWAYPDGSADPAPAEPQPPSFRNISYLDFPATGVTSGTYSVANVSVNNKGIIIGITSSIDLNLGIITATSFFGPGTNITNLNASNLTLGTVPSDRISGSYSGITSVGALTQIIVTGFSTVNNMRIGGILYDGNFSSGSVNQVLISTGTGIAWTTSAATGILTGSGTINTVAKFNTANSLTNSNITDSGTQIVLGSASSISGIVTSFGYFGPGTNITNLSASNLASGTVPSAVISGSYSGITSVGALTSLVVNGIATATTFIGNGTFINLGSVNDAIFNGNNVGRGGGNISGNVLVGGGNAFANNSSGTLNSAFGWSALNQNTTEGNNSAFGYEAAIYSKASGTTAVGARALSGSATTSNTGANNTVMGFGAGRYLNSASNVAVGNGALSGSSTAFGTGGANVAIGNQAMNVFTTAVNNVAIGAQALQLVTTGQQCVAVGESALSKNTTGNQNVAIGQRAGFNLDNSSGGGAAVLIGTQAGFTATNVGEITYVGQTAGFWATGGQNVALGAYALFGQTPGSSGTQNTAIGYAAMNVFTSGSGNVALGQAALNKMTTAGSNVALGYLAQQENLTGSFNVAVGRQAHQYYTSTSNQIAIGYQALSGSATTALNTGTENVAVGYRAGFANTSGTQNTFIGNSAGLTNTSGISNTFVGYTAGQNNTTGGQNVAIGRQALLANTSGSANVAVGENALPTATTATNNTAVGNRAMLYVTTQGSQVAVGYNALAGNSTTALNTGQLNTALGNNAGAANTSGSFNVFVGHNAGAANTTGNSNTFVGSYAGQNNTTGTNNTFVGSTAGGNNRSGLNNTAVGLSAANQLTTGSSNCYLGRQAAYYNISGNDNVAIGENGLFNFETSSNQIAIGRNALFGNNTRALNTGGNNVAVGYAAGTAVTSGIGNVFVGHLAGDTITSGFSNIIIGNQADGTATANYQIALGELVIPTASNLGAWGGNTNSTRTNLGVGTFTPLSRLHIETLAASNLGLYIAGAASQTGNLIEVDATTNGTQLFVVTGIGSVGINTSVASRYLYNQGDTRLNGNVGVLGEPINGYPLSVYGNMYMRQGDVLSWSAGNADISSGSGGAFDLRFRTYDGVSATRENMRIMSNGNVGIGTTGPFARLHVQGLSTTNTPLIISGFGTPTVDLFRIEQSLNGTRYVTVGSAGSVGIGTSLPSQSLHIQNNSRFNGAIFDVNNLPGAPVGIVSQALFSTGTGVTWAPVKRNLVVPLMTAFNPTQVGIDSAIFIVPQDPINGTSSMTFNFRRVNVRVETPSAAGITTINIAKSIGTGAFLGTSILSANINLTGASTFEAFGTSFAVGFTTASSGDKLAINFVGVNTFHQNLTVELIAIEA